MSRYLERMDRFDVEKRACRAGGVTGQVAGAGPVTVMGRMVFQAYWG